MRILVVGILAALIGVCDNVKADEIAKVDIDGVFSPSGWMGDGEYGRKYIDFSGASSKNPHSPPSSTRIAYTFGPKRWGGIYWLNIPDNWGDDAGSDYSGRSISRLVFWARGETGDEIVEFKSGGVRSPGKKFRDSYRASTGRVRLSREWTRFEIDLSNRDLSSVIGGFCWVASADYNSFGKIVFYLDDLRFE